MTRYEQGFLTKCAERGLDANTSLALMSKVARETRDHGEGALLGAKIGLGVGATSGATWNGLRTAAILGPELRKLKLKGKIGAILKGLGMTTLGAVGGAAVPGIPLAIGGAALGGLIGRKNKD